MSFSMFDLYKVSIGPSSTYTLGPMLACSRFIAELAKDGLLHGVQSLSVELFGALAVQAKEHNSTTACVLGLMGYSPDQIEIEDIPKLLEKVKQKNQLALAQQRIIRFDLEENIISHTDKLLTEHPNGITLTAKGNNGSVLYRRTYFSLGGGKIVAKNEQPTSKRPVVLPYPFNSAHELLTHCEQQNCSIAHIMFTNELAIARHSDPEATMESIYHKLDALWVVMAKSIQRGMHDDGVLPGGLEIPRRAHIMHKNLKDRGNSEPKVENIDWVNVYAMAAIEENAAGQKVVSVPSNGAAGVLPAVLAYYNQFISSGNTEGIRVFLATAAAIGCLFKQYKSINSANLGCQGEVGVACAMAAAGLAAVKGGTPKQVENAAELGMEHNLGLTCDPMNGLIQVPCIGRNTMGAIKAINAARLSVRGGEKHFISLDSMIQTIHQTAKDMNTKIKQNSLQELVGTNIPINFILC